MRKSAPEKQIKIVKEAPVHTETIDISTFRPVADPQFCEDLPSGREYEYVWNQDACACFFKFKLGLRARCTQSNPVQNPFHEVGNYYDLCIPEADYYEIFDHPWGADCIPGTEDDPGYIKPDIYAENDPQHIDSHYHDKDPEHIDSGHHEDHVEPPVVHPVNPEDIIPTGLTSNPNPEFQHTYTQDACTETQTFKPNLCACMENEYCEHSCMAHFPETPYFNPLEKCECISADALHFLLDHGYGEDCGAPVDVAPEPVEDPAETVQVCEN